jgi:hypothetical protein
MHSERFRSAFFPVIPGHRAAMNPEPMNTDLEQLVSAPENILDQTVFMGSGFGPTAAPE